MRKVKAAKTNQSILIFILLSFYIPQLTHFRFSMISKASWNGILKKAWNPEAKISTSILVVF
jgi:hypothetical protein